jgi:hypothetical protein
VIIALDFDGVLHSDIQGLGSGNIILDPPVEGAFAKLDEMLRCDEVERVFIYSLRCGGQHGIAAMNAWIVQEFRRHRDVPDEELQLLFDKVQFSWVKPHADVYIDDRALPFNGDWSDPSFDIDSLLNFRPWNKKKGI